MKTIFVSSTFKDMHFERDAIQEITLPALRIEAMKYGESVSFCDLRWGINTGDLDSEEGARKVLDVCLDEIDRCKPPMVVILGNRYGWIPSEYLTQSAAERKKIELEDLQISVTALEIAYGALSTPDRCRQTLFYFRHIESDCPRDYSVEDAEHKEKLNQLKSKINELTGGRIKHYSVSWNGEQLEGVISFAKMLAEDIKEVLLPEWKKKEILTPFERERLTHWSFITEKNEMFSARSALVQKYYDDLTQNGKHFLAIKAPSGSGKSMLFSNLALKLRDAGYNVVPFMSGLTSESNDSIDILRNLIYYLEDLLGFSHESADSNFKGLDSSTESKGEESNEKKNGINKLRGRLLELCVECEQADRRVVIMIDAVDQLASDDNRDNLIFIPARLSDNVKFVMTCLPELNLVGRNATTLKQINDAEKREVVDGILKSHNRELEEKVIRRMIKLKASKNPLFLSLLVQRLLMMNRDDFRAIKQAGDDMKAISKHQLTVIETCPDSLQKMSAALLIEAGKRINEELVLKVAEYLSVSRHGLRREDLSALLGDKWSALDFAHFLTYMAENFIQRDDGRFDFSHKCIREGFIKICRNVKRCHQEIVDHFYYSTGNDSVCISEIAHHCIMANNKVTLMRYILNNEDQPNKLLAVSKTLFKKCESDDCAWLRNMFMSVDNRTDFVKLCEFAIVSFDPVWGSSLKNARTLYQLSRFICEEIDRKNDNDEPSDISYNLLMIKAYIWHAECNKKLITSSYYKEGDYFRFVSCYEKAYAIAEKSVNKSTDLVWMQYKAECAFQLMPHDTQTNKWNYGNFEYTEIFSNIDYCKKAAECIEKILEIIPKNQSNLYMIKYAICQIALACLEEYHIEKKLRIHAIHRGENQHIKIAIKIASELETRGYSAIDKLLILQLYQELTRYFSDVNNTEYMNTSLFFLQKILSIFEKDSDVKISLDKKTYLQSVLIKYIQYQISYNNFCIGEYIEHALNLTKEIYLKTQNVKLLYDVISLNGAARNCITRKGKCFSDVNTLLALEFNTGRYFYETGVLTFVDKILMKSIFHYIDQYLYGDEQSSIFFKKLLSVSVFGSTMILLFLCSVFEPYRSVKSSFWIKAYFGGVMSVIRNIKASSKFDESKEKNMIRIYKLIEFYLTIRKRQEKRIAK